MSLVEILPEVRSLPREDKLRLLHFLVEKLAVGGTRHAPGAGGRAAVPGVLAGPDVSGRRGAPSAGEACIPLSPAEHVGAAQPETDAQAPRPVRSRHVLWARPKDLVEYARDLADRTARL